MVGAGPSRGESEQKKRREKQLGQMAGQDRLDVAAGRAERAQNDSSASDQKLWTPGGCRQTKSSNKTLTGRRDEVVGSIWRGMVLSHNNIIDRVNSIIFPPIQFHNTSPQSIATAQSYIWL